MIFTLLATIGGAIATTVTTAATTVATTVATVSATEVLGGVTVATLAKGAAALTAGGLAAAAIHDDGYQTGKTEGKKEGYAEASKVYEEKFQSLRSQLNKANITIAEQKQYIAKLRELNTDMRTALEYYRALGENVSLMELTSYNVSNLLERYAA